jgi:hypothetical protein
MYIKPNPWKYYYCSVEQKCFCGSKFLLSDHCVLFVYLFLFIVYFPLFSIKCGEIENVCLNII